MATTTVSTGGQKFSTMTAQADTVAGLKQYRAIWLNFTHATPGTIALQADSTTIWSQNMSQGDFAVLPFNTPQYLRDLTVSTAPASSVLVTVFYTDR